MNSQQQKTQFKYQGYCYCESIKFEISIDGSSNKCLYCHCESCRRAHSSPLYQICYIPKTCFRITSGQQFVKEYSRDIDSRPIRAFCCKCGSRIYNLIPLKPELGIGIFPALLDQQTQHNLPQKLRPTKHHLSVESVICLSKIDDQLPRQ